MILLDLFLFCLGVVIFGILFQYLDTFCQAAFSDKHIVKYYTFENMHTKIRGSSEGIIISKFTSTLTHSILIFRRARGTNTSTNLSCSQSSHTIFLQKGKGLSWILVLFFRRAIVNKGNRCW